MCSVRGVSRISFRGGGGSKYFLKSGGICIAQSEATRLLGGLGGMLPREIFKNGAIWCVLENILLKICKKNKCKNILFLYKNNRKCIPAHTIFRGNGAYSADFLSIVQFGVFWSTFSVKFLLR